MNNSSLRKRHVNNKFFKYVSLGKNYDICILIDKRLFLSLYSPCFVLSRFRSALVVFGLKLIEKFIKHTII